MGNDSSDAFGFGLMIFIFAFTMLHGKKDDKLSIYQILCGNRENQWVASSNPVERRYRVSFDGQFVIDDNTVKLKRCDVYDASNWDCYKANDYNSSQRISIRNGTIIFDSCYFGGTMSPACYLSTGRIYRFIIWSGLETATQVCQDNKDKLNLAMNLSIH